MLNEAESLCLQLFMLTIFRNRDIIQSEVDNIQTGIIKSVAERIRRKTQNRPLSFLR